MEPGKKAELQVVVHDGIAGMSYLLGAKRFERNGGVVAIVNQSVMAGTSAIIRIHNIGNQAVSWAMGEVVTRGILLTKATPGSQVSLNPYNVGQIEIDAIEFGRVKTGDIRSEYHEQLLHLLSKMSECFQRATLVWG